MEEHGRGEDDRVVQTHGDEDDKEEDELVAHHLCHAGATQTRGVMRPLLIATER